MTMLAWQAPRLTVVFPLCSALQYQLNCSDDYGMSSSQSSKEVKVKSRASSIYEPQALMEVRPWETAEGGGGGKAVPSAQSTTFKACLKFIAGRLAEVRKFCNSYYLLPSQFVRIMEAFPVEFGGAREEVAVCAFGRLTDLEDYFSLLRDLIPARNGRLASVIARLGWLNVWHPKHFLVPKGKAIPIVLCLALADERAMTCTLIDTLAENRGSHYLEDEARGGSSEHVCELRNAIVFDKPPVDGYGNAVSNAAVVSYKPLEVWDVFRSIPRYKNVPRTGFFCCFFYNEGLLPRNEQSFNRTFLSSALPVPTSLKETSLYKGGSTHKMSIG